MISRVEKVTDWAGMGPHNQVAVGIQAEGGKRANSEINGMDRSGIMRLQWPLSFEIKEHTVDNSRKRRLLVP